MHKRSKAVSHTVVKLATAAATGLALLLAIPAHAREEYPAPAYFQGNLNEQSSWSAIRATPGLKAEFPYVGFGATYVSLADVCIDGQMLAVVNPQLDPGARVAAAELLAQAQVAADRVVGEPRARLAASTLTTEPDGTVVRYPVSVYRYIQDGFQDRHIFLFEKPWPIRACPAK